MLHRGDDLLRCKTLFTGRRKTLILLNQYLKSNPDFENTEFRRLTPQFMTVYTFALPMNGRRPWPLL